MINAHKTQLAIPITIPAFASPLGFNEFADHERNVPIGARTRNTIDANNMTTSTKLINAVSGGSNASGSVTAVGPMIGSETMDKTNPTNPTDFLGVGVKWSLVLPWFSVIASPLKIKLNRLPGMPTRFSFQSVGIVSCVSSALIRFSLLNISAACGAFSFHRFASISRSCFH